uniref:Uncharacterized protein n=1 Tax=Megaselia scalaris TaxID=36166 RepID=T1GNQ8_MEGSC
CITECRALTIFKTCGCIPFFYPPLKVSDSDDDPRQCNLKDVKCLADNKHIFSSLEPTTETFTIYNGTINGMNCDCVPSCTEQTFG